jgi:hypothetical protein
MGTPESLTPKTCKFCGAWFWIEGTECCSRSCEVAQTYRDETFKDFGVPEFVAGEKPTNPKDALGTDKLPLHLWPATATAMGCVGLANGAFKYGRSNFREIGVRASIYVDAAKRHLEAWFEGEEVDTDDGVPHLAAALACVAIIVDARAAGKMTDDRNIAGGYRNLVTELTPHIKRLRELHAAKAPKHYTIADNAGHNAPPIRESFLTEASAGSWSSAPPARAWPGWKRGATTLRSSSSPAGARTRSEGISFTGRSPRSRRCSTFSAPNARRLGVGCANL